MGLRTVGVRLAAEVSGYTNNLRAAARSTRDFTSELDRAARAGKLDAVADQAATMGLTLAAAFGGIAAVTAKFDKQMSEVGAVSGATAGEMGKLRDAALAAGKATSFSATEAAQAEAELAKAGLSTADILGGALAGSLDLAAAGSLDLAEAADISAKAMNIFGLTGGNVGHIADVLAAAANKSATDVHEMGEALKMGGLAAHAAGMGLEDTVGTLSAFADNALNGSDAGTSLKTALMMLQAPADKSAKLMKELGIKAYDASGQFVGTAKLAGNLQSALGGLTQEQRNSALATIFGADGMRAANVLYGLGEKGIRDYIAAVDDQGAAAETARKKTDNLAGDIDRLTGSLETMAIEAGTGANTGLRTLVQAADGAVGAFSNLPGPVQSTATVLAGVAGAGLLTAAGFIKVRGTASEAMTQLRNMGPAGTAAATGLSKVGAIAGKATLWALALLAVYEASKLFVGYLNSDVEPAKRSVDGMTKSLKELADTGKVQGELAKAFGQDLSGLGKQMDALNVAADKLPQGLTKNGNMMDDLGQGMADAGREAAGLNKEIAKAGAQAAENFAVVDKALAGLVTEGGITQAKIAFEGLAERWRATGKPMSELVALFPEYNKAVGGAAMANTGLAKGFGDLGSNARTMAGGLQEAIDKGQTLLDVWKQLNGAAISSAEAEIKAEEAIDRLSEAFHKNGKALNKQGTDFDINTAKGRENKQLTLDLIQVAADAAQKKLEETGLTADASAVYDTYIGRLRDTLAAQGMQPAQIEAIIAKYASMPKPVNSAAGAVENLGYKIKTLPNGKKILVSAETGRAITAAQAAVARINAMRATIMVTANPGGGFGGNRHSGAGYSTGMRWGGIYEHAEQGLINLRQAATFSPQGPARYAFAEPATGGEAFIPKNGDRARSLGILEKAANWYGASVMPQQPMYVSGGGGGTQVVEHRHVVVLEGTGVLRGLQKEIRISGGVAKVFPG